MGILEANIANIASVQNYTYIIFYQYQSSEKTDFLIYIILFKSDSNRDYRRVYFAIWSNPYQLNNN